MLLRDLGNGGEVVGDCLDNGAVSIFAGFLTRLQQEFGRRTRDLECSSIQATRVNIVYNVKN